MPCLPGPLRARALWHSGTLALWHSVLRDSGKAQSLAGDGNPMPAMPPRLPPCAHRRPQPHVHVTAGGSPERQRPLQKNTWAESRPRCVAMRLAYSRSPKSEIQNDSPGARMHRKSGTCRDAWEWRGSRGSEGGSGPRRAVGRSPGATHISSMSHLNPCLTAALHLYGQDRMQRNVDRGDDDYRATRAREALDLVRRLNLRLLELEREQVHAGRGHVPAQQGRPGRVWWL